MKTPAFVTRDMQSIIIGVTSYMDKIPQGFIQNPGFSGKRTFKSTIQLIFLIEELLDSLNFPQRETNSRFSSKTWFAQCDALPEKRQEEPLIATFRLQVLFRQNSSWQGNLNWIDNSADAYFRSALELIGILDNALSLSE